MTGFDASALVGAAFNFLRRTLFRSCSIIFLMRSFLRSIVTVVVTAGVCFSLPAKGASGDDPVTSFDLVASRLVADPERGLIYSSVTDSNTVAVIDPTTLAVTKQLAVGLGPIGMSISPDGTKLYVALSGAKKIALIDLTTLTVLPSLNIAEEAYDIEAGLANRLYVTPWSTNDDFLQVDATTGQTQQVIDSLYQDGRLEINSDRTLLYFGDKGLSPSTLRRYDVSSPTATLLEQSEFYAFGSDGADLKLSHNDQLLSFPSQIGNDLANGTYLIDPFNFGIVYGTVTVSDHPGRVAFSPDDKVFYQGLLFGQNVYLFNVATSAQIATLNVPSDAISDLVTDSTGRYLFVAGDTAIEVFDFRPEVTETATATVGMLFSYDAPIYIASTSITATGLPAGLTMNEATGDISGVPTDTGSFPIVITATDGTNTVTVNLTISVYLNSRALNISTRARVETEDNVLIAGFIIQGDIDKEVVVRGIGPSLAVDGLPVSGRLLDPTLELHAADGTEIAFNDNWGTDDQASVLSDLALAPSDYKEPALYRVLSPGAYTVIIRGVSDTTGIALAEVYDIATGEDDNPRLANISTRGRVETGDGVMIGGFIIGGQDQAPMLIRALGPSLPLSDALADPQIDLYNSQGTRIQSNDNWRDTQEAEIEASGLAPSDDHESAISTTLAAGPYTAIVSGVGGASGVGLVEAYNLPQTALALRSLKLRP